MQQNSNYIISGGIEGKKRLHILSDILQPYTKPLLQNNGLIKGTSFFDLGCGGGGVSLMAAKIVGDTGSVTAIDFDQEIISLDIKDAEEQHIKNLTYHAQSAYDINYSNQFDVVYSRFLLSHLKEPQLVLNNMLRSAKPGGRVVVEDIDFSGHFCHPACNAFNQYVNLFTATAQQRGQNANIGPHLLSMFKVAGIQQVSFDVIQPAFNTGPGKQMALITMDKIKHAVISEGLTDAKTANTILTGLEAFTNDERSIISLPRIFRVWGLKK
nr:class I SAM-dependent methyltransferase [Mucilaginibacter sp. L294]